MKIKKFILIAFTAIACTFTGCEYDNFTEPTSTLRGRIVYDGEPVGVRTNGPQLELWDEGQELSAQFPIHIAHDGTFSAVVYDGEYKLVRKANSPWLPALTDTVVVQVNGHTEIDIPVQPYFTISNNNIQQNDGSVTVTFTLNKVVETANLDHVNLYFGKNILIDDIRHDHKSSVAGADVIIDGTNTVTAHIPERLSGLGYIFVRIGVKASASSELYYTQVQKIDL